MASQIDIFNMALTTKLGLRAISSLSENTESARNCSRVWDFCLEYVLRSHNWNFAKKQSELILMPEKLINWDYLYSYPINCLYIRRIFNEKTIQKNGNEEFEEVIIDGNHKVIATNMENAYIEYTTKINDYSLFDPMFTECLVCFLAYQLATPLTGNNSLKQSLQQEYALKIEQSKLTNSNQINIIENYISDYQKARR